MHTHLRQRVGQILSKEGVYQNSLTIELVRLSIRATQEKLRSEVATYIWIPDNYSEVSIPRSREFGFAGGWNVCELSYVIYLINNMC